MANNSSIEWTEATWNPVVGCTRASAGCDHCYAVTMTNRLEAMGQPKYRGLTVLNKAGDRHFNGVVRTVEKDLTIPLKRKAPTVYFVNSMSDLFHRDVPFEFIDKVFAVMAMTPQHTYQILTKRPERMAIYTDRARQRVQDQVVMDRMFNHGTIAVGELRWPLSNVWLGTSVENQEAADERIPHLLKCHAAVRFLSAEPLLGPVYIEQSHTGFLYQGSWTDMLAKGGIHWVIVGGESGPNARPCNIEWIRSIVSQCSLASVKCFVKQVGKLPYQRSDEDHPKPGKIWEEATCDPEPRVRMDWITNKKGGDMNEWPEDLRVRQMPVAP